MVIEMRKYFLKKPEIYPLKSGKNFPSLPGTGEFPGKKSITSMD